MFKRKKEFYIPFSEYDVEKYGFRSDVNLEVRVPDHAFHLLLDGKSFPRYALVRSLWIAAECPLFWDVSQTINQTEKY